MPYIPQEKRLKFKEILKLFGDIAPKLSTGEMNYLITLLCYSHLINNGGASYAGFNKLIGILESVKLEFYRRCVVDYEEKKRKESGDVYND